MFAYSMVTNKSEVNTSVGADTITIGPQLKLVTYDKNGACRECNSAEALKVLVRAGEDEYLEIVNPPEDPASRPPFSKATPTPTLDYGRKVIVPGPFGTAPWPGEMITVVKIPRMGKDEYIICRVYNAEQAQANWDKVKFVSQADDPDATGEGEASSDEKDGKTDTAGEFKFGTIDPQEFTDGFLFGVYGSDCSSFTPCTGIEVVPESDGEYVRQGEQLDAIEYCKFRGGGKFRYVYGPAIAFPTPMEQFVEEDGRRKFNSIELPLNSGIHLRALESFGSGEDEVTKDEELFWTDSKIKVFRPRQELSMIRRGKDGTGLYYAMAVPDGKVIYVLDKTTGRVENESGPKMVLPDPRTQILVNRILDARTVKLWYPNNTQALAVNEMLAAKASETYDAKGVRTRDVSSRRAAFAVADDVMMASLAEAEEDSVGPVGGGVDHFTRPDKFQAPPAIILDYKYSGAPKIKVWTGFAVEVVNSKGVRRVVSEGETIHLKHDEDLTILEFSQNENDRKGSDRSKEGVYLQTRCNKVSDIVSCVTSDGVEVDIPLKFWVNFEELEKSFAVHNYVDLLYNRMRSIIRSLIRKHGIQEVLDNAAELIRDTILGKKEVGGADDEIVGRHGFSFDENGMRVYEIDVKVPEVTDEDLRDQLDEAQSTALRQTLKIAEKKRELDATRELEQIDREILDAEEKTKIKRAKLSTAEVQRALDLELAEGGKTRDIALARVSADADVEDGRFERENDLAGRELEAKKAAQNSLGEIATAELDRENATRHAEFTDYKQRLEADVSSVKERMAAITPDLVKALQTSADAGLAEKLAGSMGPLAILGGDNLLEVAQKLLGGLSVSGVVQGLTKRLSSDSSPSEE
jgi:major vault protein